MAKARAAWGIEVGSAAIKAIRLERDGSDVRVADFVVIPHPKVLTTPDLNIEEMLRISLGAFITQKSLEGAVVLIGVPGNDSLSRFAKLPPIPKKAVPQTVMFEAKQQIPFPLEEVEWDYHLFASDDSPELEVGIFAVLKEKIAQRLSLYKELGLAPSAITLCPLAVYNCMIFDRDLDRPGSETVAFLDIGTRSSDLVVVADGRCWIRTFPIGGHHFTEAVATAFSVPYGKADRLKAEAATHKYAKQLMHAMRPVFDDLLQEVQRSIGHFQSIRPEKPINRIVGLGSTFRIPGLRKFLSDQLGVEIRRQEEYEKIKVEGSAAADFSANAMNLATATGLALQGLGFSEIDINLSPAENMREQVWRSKSKWFVAAALITVVASALLFWNPGGTVSPEVPGIVRTMKTEGEAAKKSFDQAKSASDLGSRANNMVFLLEDREVWPWIVNDVYTAVGTVGAQAELLKPFDVNKPPVPYDRWNLVDVTNISGKYALAGDAGKPEREIEVTLNVTVPREKSEAPAFVQNSLLAWFNKNAERDAAPYTIVIDKSTGILPTFREHGAAADSGGPPGRNTGAVEEPTETETSGASSSGTNMGQTGVDAKRKHTGDLITSPGIKPKISGAGTGGDESPSDTGTTTGGARKPRARQPIMPTNTGAPDAAREPINLDTDAAIPAKPDLFKGQKATDVTIKFKVRLKPLKGRTLTAPPAGAGGADAAAAGEPAAEEGAQQ